jgi:hypothetical protein
MQNREAEWASETHIALERVKAEANQTHSAQIQLVEDQLRQTLHQEMAAFSTTAQDSPMVASSAHCNPGSPVEGDLCHRMNAIDDTAVQLQQAYVDVLQRMDKEHEVSNQLHSEAHDKISDLDTRVDSHFAAVHTAIEKLAVMVNSIASGNHLSTEPHGETHHQDAALPETSSPESQTSQRDNNAAPEKG